MPAPVLEGIYPNDESTGIPIRADIELTFDIGIDLKSAIDNVVLYGPDRDRVSGPDQALWVDKETGKNPYFLKSPGLKGTVPADYSIVYLDASGTPLDPQPEVLSQEDESYHGYKCRVVATPKAPLAPETNYSLYIVGRGEAGDDSGLSQRTVFDVDTSAASSETGALEVYGQWEGETSDVVHVKITKAGDVGTALYKWWYASLGEASAVKGKKTSRRYRKLEDGLQLRFSGSGYEVGDVYTFHVEPRVYFASSHRSTFTTGSGSIEVVPETASTSIIGGFSSLQSDVDLLEIAETLPEDGAYNLPLSTRRIKIWFTSPLDETTITDDTVRVYTQPVSGEFTGSQCNAPTSENRELKKRLTVDSNLLIIDI